MNKQLSINQLMSLGLEDIEAILYVHLLENGAQTPLELSRELNINRSKIYRFIEKLTAKKLIEESVVDRGVRIKASDIRNIELMLQDKEQALKTQKDMLPAILDNLQNLPVDLKQQFEVKHYHGADGLKQMLWNHLSAKKEIVGFSYKNKNDMVGKPFAEQIREEQVERKIMLYEVENETDQGDLWYTNVTGWNKYYSSRYISPEILAIKQYIAVYNNTVSIANWVDRVLVGVEIENAIFAETQRQIFWQLWKIAGPAKTSKKK